MPLPPFDHTLKPYSGPSLEEVLAARRQFVNPTVFTYYKNPLMLVEGKMQYVYDEKGRRYLDAFGGIVTVSVGHCHPHVVAALREQIETLQHSTTIYLHPNLPEYARLLASKMPGDLKVCYFVNSGSEANDLAVMMARVYTENYDIIALRNAYHGGTAGTMALTGQNTWKFNVPHSFGAHHVLAPYPYRGLWGNDDPEAGRKYAADLQDQIETGTNGQIAAFIAESIQGVGGAITYPAGYLQAAYTHARAAGGLCIADEVQTGFGRTGTHYWGFETQGVIPDIVTMAKGIGNGFPLAAVVTTAEIASVFTKKIHFNTFGGNPMACAQGKAVLEVIDREGLQHNSLEVGGYLRLGLEKLQAKHSLIGEVRGAGLMLAAELVKDRATKEPARDECARIFERAKELGLVIGKGGLKGNVLRIKPPMCVTKADADFLVEVLDQAFAEA